jgi:hypothetical protein
MQPVAHVLRQVGRLVGKVVLQEREVVADRPALQTRQADVGPDLFASGDLDAVAAAMARDLSVRP